MILNLKKFTSIKDIRWDLTAVSPCIYVLILVDDKTPRYRRENGELIVDPQGTWIKDPGYDPLKRSQRVLIYIGETINEWLRIYDHYYCGEKGRGGRSKEKAKGIGPIFTHVRMIKGFKRLSFDSVRVHEETKLVRKYLPEKNQASQFSDKYVAIMLNSEGKVSPWDLMYPYLIHGRDYYKAFIAWRDEDMSLIEKDLVIPNNTTLRGEPYMNQTTNDFYRKGVKMRFHRWFKDIVIQRHIKQIEAMKQWRRNFRIWERQYASDFYEQRLIRDRNYNRSGYKKTRKQFLINIGYEKKEQDS